MLYIVTVHYRSPRWIEIQHRYLRRHIQVPLQVWTSLEGIEGSYGSYFDRVLEQQGTHAAKLNHLAMEVTHVAADDDLLMFLDGDAFTIADPMPLIDESLQRAPLLAVRRAENVDEPQPHPCFCVTTVGTWRSLPGDWTAGPTWTGAHGRPTSDVGANLLRKLELSQTPLGRRCCAPTASTSTRCTSPSTGTSSTTTARASAPASSAPPTASTPRRPGAQPRLRAREAARAPVRRAALAPLGTLHERAPGARIRACLRRDRVRRGGLAGRVRLTAGPPPASRGDLVGQRFRDGGPQAPRPHEDPQRRRAGHREGVQERVAAVGLHMTVGDRAPHFGRRRLWRWRITRAPGTAGVTFPWKLSWVAVPSRRARRVASGSWEPAGGAR